MIIALYIHIASCFTIGKLQTKINRLKWLLFIYKVQFNCLHVFKFYDIRNKVSKTTVNTISNIHNAPNKHS